MFGWYDPLELAKTAIRVASASIFGEFFDRRELMATGAGSRPLITHDYSGEGELWLDFTADTGDGYWPVFAVARLMARPELRVGGHALPRARAVLFGGDEVYPTASREAYRVRLNAPFLDANRAETGGASLGECHVYAIPGNHDWYDGLTAFMGLFCARTDAGEHGRDVCGRRTKQHRSYFTLALPGGWWLIGADIQLAGYVDRGQIEYLGRVARELPAGANLILLTAEPSWCEVDDEHPPDAVFRNYSFLEGVVTGAIDVETFEQATPRHALRVVLTGDKHHYAHFVERAPGAARWGGEADRDDVRHYFTCGLGGTFLHPTHTLRPLAFPWRYASPPPVGARERTRGGGERVFDLVTCYPPPSRSRALAWRNLAFGARNWKFAAFLGSLAGVAGWAVAGFVALSGPDLAEQIRPSTTLAEAVGGLTWSLLTYPWGLLGVFLLALALRKFSAIRGGWRGWAVGVAHAAAHVAAFVLLVVSAARFVPYCEIPVVLGLVTALGAALVSSVIFGAYLLVSLNFFGRHVTEAFSSLRIADYKGLLRMRVGADGALTIYPVVIDRVPSAADGALEPQLAEAPITIRGAPVA